MGSAPSAEAQATINGVHADLRLQTRLILATPLTAKFVSCVLDIANGEGTASAALNQFLAGHGVATEHKRGVPLSVGSGVNDPQDVAEISMAHADRKAV